MLGFPFPPRRRGYWILAFLDKDLDHVGEEAIEFRISALALGDGIHFPALVRLLGSSFPDRGRTYIVVFPFLDWDRISVSGLGFRFNELRLLRSEMASMFLR